MNKQKELAKNTIILTVGKICTQFASFLLLPLYTTLLRPDDFGVVDLFNTYILLLVPLFNWQFENGLFRFMIDCRNQREKQKELFSTVFMTNMMQVIVYLLFYFAIQNFIHSEYKIFLAIDVALNIFLNTLLQFPRGLGKNTDYAIGSFISAVSTILFNLFFILILRLGAYGMFMATVVAKLATITYLIFSQKIWCYFSVKKCNLQVFKQVCKYSMPLVPNSLSWWVIGVSDRTIISWFLGVGANGIYSIANKFSSVYSTFYNIFNMSWTESVSLHMNDEDRDVFLTETINSMFNIFASIAFGIIAYMPLAFPLLINEKYADAYYQIPILIIGILFQVIMGLYSVIYVALKKSTEIAKSTVYSAIINILINISLIKYIGIYAASISTLLSFMFVALYRYFDIRRYVNVKFRTEVIVKSCLMGIFTVTCYYYNQVITNIIMILSVSSYALLVNKDFLKSARQIIKNKLTSHNN